MHPLDEPEVREFLAAFAQVAKIQDELPGLLAECANVPEPKPQNRWARLGFKPKNPAHYAGYEDEPRAIESRRNVLISSSCNTVVKLLEGAARKLNLFAKFEAVVEDDTLRIIPTNAAAERALLRYEHLFKLSVMADL